MANSVKKLPLQVPPGVPNTRRSKRPLLKSPEIEAAIDKQRFRLWETAGIIESVAIALNKRLFDGDWPAGMPEFHRALHASARMIFEVADELETPCLEDCAQQLVKGASHGR